MRSAAVPLSSMRSPPATPRCRSYRIADIGAVAIAALKTIAPTPPPKLPDDMDGDAVADRGVGLR